MGHVLPNLNIRHSQSLLASRSFKALTLREADGRMEPDSPTIQTNHAY